MYLYTYSCVITVLVLFQAHICGWSGDSYGIVLSSHLRGIGALEMQLPSDVVMIPDMYPVDGISIRALVDFHKGLYRFPESPAGMAKRLVVADILGDDEFFAFSGP